MSNKMLIDSSHPEETRVVVVRQNRVEEFDFESAAKKQLRGNIYLAKVIRVEPSLQAAFVDYGGGRHGFLAFAEIHPDYYQIPVADRLALLEEEARQSQEEDEFDERPRRSSQRVSRRRRDRSKIAARYADQDAPLVQEDAPAFALDESPADADAFTASGTDLSHEPTLITLSPVEDEPVLDFSLKISEHPKDEPEEYAAATPPEMRNLLHDDESGDYQAEDAESFVEQLGGDDREDVASPRMRSRRSYKIQEVIKRRQVLLVQVAKEERGNKGASLTTYLSLAGRYSVLMPNTARGGGISRKITDPDDRKRLKEIVSELEVPQGMGVILRTAGASRTRPEVRRDFEYLLRMWESIREVTLRSVAPVLVYEEGSLVKRSIRDLYTKEVDEVIVAGEAGYKEAHDFMQMLLPSHTKSVILYNDAQPLFARYGVETQLDAMFSNNVPLRSGGYLVINQTEALVSIDVNSGKSTREHHIEDTAVRTNLEAADEVARQLRLRDLAGLIVVDFIDMAEHRNDRSVERRLKDALKNDRARIQVGRISPFGLLEMSRQRLRSGMFEGSSVICPHCHGTGHVRSTASVALRVLRALEEALIKNAHYNPVVRTRSDVALYILNHKRPHLRDLEETFGVSILVAADESLVGMTYHAIERGEPVSLSKAEHRHDLVRIDSVDLKDLSEEEDTNSDIISPPENKERNERSKDNPRRRRRRKDRPEGDEQVSSPELASPDTETSVPVESDASDPSASMSSRSASAARRSRRRSLSDKKRQTQPSEAISETPAPLEIPVSVPVVAVPPPSEPPVIATPPEPQQPTPAPSQPKLLPELPEATPPSSKRTGWWGRAKATFSGG